MGIRMNEPVADPASSTIIQEASTWDSRLRAPDCTADDRARFATWRDAEPAHSLAFERLQLVTASLRHDRGRADVRALRDEALRAVGTRRRRRFAWAAAASVVFALPVAFWATPVPPWLRQPIDTVVARITGSETYATGIGQRSTFVLEDGSVVELNAQSKVSVTFTETQRDVKLVRGQALFNVAKNPQRPFVVHAGNREIVAVGTEFDVRLDTHSVQVTLIEGKVRITSPRPALAAQTPATIPLHEPKEILLTPGKQLIAELQDASSWHDRRPNSHSEADSPRPAQQDELADSAGTNNPEITDVIRNIDVAKITGWRDGRVFLENLSLADAVVEMNKYSITQIRIGDRSLASLRVNGMFVAGGQQAFATALESYFPLVAERHGDKEIVLTSRD